VQKESLYSLLISLASKIEQNKGEEHRAKEIKYALAQKWEPKKT
jgi:hypothetical protein